MSVAVESLSLEEKVGQLFMLAFEGDSTADAEVLLGTYLVGGVYLSQDNLRSIEGAVALMDGLQDIALHTPRQLPIFAGCDQEGAWAVLTPHTTSGPGNLALGATTPEQVEEMYAVIGRELRALGIGAALAPVADVNSDPRNPIIGSRSFGAEPDRVAACVAAAVRGLHRGGVRACAKHFPGHGDTSHDSHRGLATVNHGREQMHAVDLAPFRAAIANQVDVIMTAHLLYPAYDPQWPATLSPALLTGLLREELGFEGVVLTDSFSMGAIRRVYGVAEAAIRAINAGADLVMLAEERYGDEPKGYLANQIALVEAVRSAVRDGTIPQARLDQAVRRILKLKTDAGLFESIHPSLDEARRVVGGADHRAIELAAARGAVTIIRDEERRLPLALPSSAPLIVLSPVPQSARGLVAGMRGIGPNLSEPPVETFYREVVRRHPGATLLSLADPGDLPGYLPRLLTATVIVVTENYPLPGFDFPTQAQHAVILALVREGVSPIVVGLRDPYELPALDGIGTYISALGYAPVCARAAAEVLFGERPAPRT
ncbi:MAG TPA: glycoside hydrolase family 3 N-terminal domain-containing protein [Chloroflexota bacterium]|nr:glycoside hydrolase family 3 N-terminal domain-containing protein [Chloroflexota bacterium]